MRRLFLPPETITAQSGEIKITGEERKYLDVLRLKVGDPLLVLDGRGGGYRCVLDSFARREVVASIVESWQETEDSLPVQLLQGLPKGGKIDLILQKGTELGVSHFLPYSAQRSVVDLNDRKRGERRGRWRRIVTEAARQSERSIIPEVEEPGSLQEALAQVDAEKKLILLERSTSPLAAELVGTIQSVAILVGPEGGFSPDEVELAIEAGFTPVSLGKRILRTETAGLAVVSIVQHLHGDLGRI